MKNNKSMDLEIRLHYIFPMFFRIELLGIIQAIILLTLTVPSLVNPIDLLHVYAYGNERVNHSWSDTEVFFVTQL